MKPSRTFARAAFSGLAALALVALAGCSGSGGGASSGQPSSSSSAAAPSSSGGGMAESGGGNIKLAYVEWSSCVAASNVIKSVLEQQGYHVKLISVSAAAMYEAVADGDADATVCAWLPSTQANYYARTKSRLENLGPNMTGTKLGLVVPSYVPIDSITQLEKKSVADKFNDQIIGIDPGAGEMGLTQKVIDQYKLPMKLVNGSGATMTAALKSAIDSHKWIVVTGWTPHWMWSRFDIKYLKDPKGIYGTAEDIDTLVRMHLNGDMPKAYKILDAFHWTPKQMQAVMAKNQANGADPASVAKQWVQSHPQVVSGWVSGNTPASASSAGPANTSSTASGRSE